MTGLHPLAGKRILVTRARHQAGELTAQLAALGAEVVEIPAIEILPPASVGPLDEALHNLQLYRWLVVTSANTVRSICERIKASGIPISHFDHLKIAAIGSATKHALEQIGLTVALTPNEYVAESLISAIGGQATGARVLIARAAVARDVIPESLARTGSQVDVVEAYRTVIPQDSIARVAELFASRQSFPDAITFTSSSTVTNFFHLLKAAGIDAAPPDIQAISIGPITTQTLREYHWEPSAEASPHDLSGLVKAILDVLKPVP